jgi:hypothetical protein
MCGDEPNLRDIQREIRFGGGRGDSGWAGPTSPHSDIAHPDIAHPDIAHPDIAHPHIACSCQGVIEARPGEMGRV